MAESLVVVTDEHKIFASIGHICLQWALLEHTVLALIAAAENMPMPKVHLVFGGMDMLPRMNMAVTLTEEAKWPLHLTKRVRAIRTALQKGGEDLSSRRNQAVHGVHSISSLPAHVKLTMVRWRGEREAQDVSLNDLHALGVRLHGLSKEAWSIFEDYGRWKFKPSSNEDASQQLRQRHSNIWLIFKKHLEGIIERLRG